MIHILDGQKDIILDYITLDNIISDNHKKSLEDTLETYDFITFANKRFSEYLEKRNRIIIPDEDGSLVEFVIFEAAKYKDTEGHKAQVFAHASYLELKKASILYPDSGFTGTASQHGGRALNDTGWQVGIVEGKGTKTLTINSHTNPYETLKRIAREFGLELHFRVTHDGNKITGRFVDLLERVGEWRGREVEFGKDLDGIRRVEKQDIVTALLGLGPEDEDGNRLEVLVTDNDALQRWGRIGEHGELKHLIEPYEIQSERTEMTETEARQYTRTALNKRINTQVKYETTIVDLENVPGMENKKIRHGDTIKIKDTTFNPPLYLEARVFEQNRSIKSKAKKDIKLGDFIEHTEEEVNAIWKQLQQQIKDRVSHYEMVEYTYDKVTIDDRDETVFKDGKTFAEATGITAEENAKAYAEEQDEIIKVDVKKYADDTAEQKAESALDQAKQYAVAKEVYDSQMDKIADDMADKAGLEYVDGQLVDKANKGDVYTVEDVDNMINNTVSITKYETDMDGIVTDLDSQGTRIGQNEKAIGLKADSTDLDAVEGSLTKKIGNVEVKADEVEISVSEIVADLDDVDGRVETLDGDITTLAGEVNLKASQSVVDSIEGRVENAESELSVLPGQIALKADAGIVDGIDDRLGSAELVIDGLESEIKLKADLVYIEGMLTADDLEVRGDLKFAGLLEGATGTFRGSVEASSFVVNNPNIDRDGFVGLKLQVAKGTDKINPPYEDTGHINFYTGRDGLELFKTDLKGNEVRLDFVDFATRVITIDGKIIVGRAGIGGSDYGIEFPDLHSISSSPNEGDFTFYGNRAGGRKPFKIRSHMDKASGSGNNSYRDDFWIDSERGTIFTPHTYGNTTTYASNLRVGTSAGHITRSTSSRKAKLVIEPIKVDPYKVLELQPSDWFDKADSEKYASYMDKVCKDKEADCSDVERIRRVPGLIAEEVEEVGLDQFVEYTENGDVAGVQYERLWTLLIPIVKDIVEQLIKIQGKIDDQEEKINEQQEKLDKQEVIINDLVQRIEKLENAE